MSFKSANLTRFPTSQMLEYRRALEDDLGPQSPQAYSIDGQTFVYEAPLTTPLGIGSYITIELPGEALLLGQVSTESVVVRKGPEYGIGVDTDIKVVVLGIEQTTLFRDTVTIRTIEGQGRLLGFITSESFWRLKERIVFRDAAVREATDDQVSRYLSTAATQYAALNVGRPLRFGATHEERDVPMLLKANGFARHTFLCGQSGSGKSYALGVILEQLLLETDLRIIVLDYNSDFIRLNQIRDRKNDSEATSNAGKLIEMDEQQYEELRERFITRIRPFHILRPAHCTDSAAGLLRIRFSDLKQVEQTAILQIEPTDDDIYRTYRMRLKSLKKSEYAFQEVHDSVDFPIQYRMDNLGVSEWGIWSLPGQSSLVDILETDYRSIVVDLGTLGTAQERAVVATTVLGTLWRSRHRKQQVLIVIDEAQNVCPQHPASRLEELSTESVVRIAAEGRKFGLYLLVVSQQPMKIHSNVLTQADNLVLMLMRSRSDLAHIAQTFGHAPTSFVDRAMLFDQGQALVAGSIVETPTFVKFSGRFTREGGSDLPKNWAERQIG